MRRPMLLFVAFLFLGFLAMQWWSYKSKSRPSEIWSLSRRRLRRMAREANDEQSAKLLAAQNAPKSTGSPLVMIASLVMTLIAIGLLLLW